MHACLRLLLESGRSGDKKNGNLIYGFRCLLDYTDKLSEFRGILSLLRKAMFTVGRSVVNSSISIHDQKRLVYVPVTSAFLHRKKCVIINEAYFILQNRILLTNQRKGWLSNRCTGRYEATMSAYVQRCVG